LRAARTKLTVCAMLSRVAFALTMFLASTAAMAGDSTQVPEGSQATLFALGILGVIVGRRLAMRDPGQD
jgi:hypothetical protein